MPNTMQGEGPPRRRHAGGREARLLRLLSYQHTALTARHWAAVASGVGWAVLDTACYWLSGRTIPFFVDGAINEQIVSLMGLLFGIYMGLAGVFAASSNEWLDEPLKNSPTLPEQPTTPLKRRSFIIDTLLYCSLVSALVVAYSGVLTPALRHLSIALLAMTDVSWARPAASVAASSVVLATVTHTMLMATLIVRYLRVRL
mgnify:CR=1 FL=1